MNSIREEVVKQIAELIGFPEDKISDETLLFGDLGMELQDIKNLLTILAKKFGSEIKPESAEMEKLTVGSLVLLIEEGQE